MPHNNNKRMIIKLYDDNCDFSRVVIVYGSKLVLQLHLAAVRMVLGMLRMTSVWSDVEQTMSIRILLLLSLGCLCMRPGSTSSGSINCVATIKYLACCCCHAAALTAPCCHVMRKKGLECFDNFYEKRKMSIGIWFITILL